MKGILMTLLAISLLLAGCEKYRLDAQVRKLCAKDGGVRVYETVLLPQNRFDEFGVVSIPAKQDAKPEDDYYYERDIYYYKTGNPEMWRINHRIIRRIDGKVLGESVRYTRRGGDLPGPWHESSFSCPGIKDHPAINRLVFKKQGDRK
jgi:hypothetical protein